MTAAALLARLDALGVTARADHGTLRLRPASAVPAELLAELRAGKDAVLTLLTANSAMPPPLDPPPASPDSALTMVNGAADPARRRLVDDVVQPAQMPTTGR